MRRSARSRNARSAASKSGSSASTARPSSLSRDAALYVHIPFCVVKCGYCDFNSFAGVDGEGVEAVLQAMLDELELRGRGLRPGTVFLGGGTPTWLGGERLGRFLDTMAEIVDLSGVEEFTCEANPESASSHDCIQTIVNKAVTRISIGAQSFQREWLSFLDRPHDAAETESAFRSARATGAAVSLDLIFGLPGQTLAQWHDDVSCALELSPDHLSCYALTYERGTPLHARRQHGEVRPLGDEAVRDMLLETRSWLGDASYEAYEISNFARSGQACRHNLNYWRGGDYLGIGPGAASHAAGRRSTNVRALDTYVRWIRDRGCASAEAETLSPERRCREAVWLGLRLAAGADLSDIHRRTGVDPDRLLRDEIDQAIATKSCERVGERLRLLPTAIPFADQVAAVFL